VHAISFAAQRCLCQELLQALQTSSEEYVMRTNWRTEQNAGWKSTRRSVLLTALSLLIGPRLLGATATEDHLMKQHEEGVEKPNPNAPKELSRFAFLIGRWKFNARFKAADGEWKMFHGTWLGRYILDGYAIADEYRMIGSSGELIVFGMNFRIYDPAKQVWNIKWLNALEGTWTDLTSEQFGGARFDGQSVTYAFKAERGAQWPFTRATYTNISRTHFTWRGEKSEDAKTWTEFMVVECDRSAD
jgi:hypothetical protein